MASPEQVSLRVERAEQDITVIADTILDIKETVDGHTETLIEHGRKLDDISEGLHTVTARIDTMAGRIDTGHRATRHAGDTDRPGLHRDPATA